MFGGGFADGVVDFGVIWKAFVWYDFGRFWLAAFEGFGGFMDLWVSVTAIDVRCTYEDIIEYWALGGL